MIVRLTSPFSGLRASLLSRQPGLLRVTDAHFLSPYCIQCKFPMGYFVPTEVYLTKYVIGKELLHPRLLHTCRISARVSIMLFCVCYGRPKKRRAYLDSASSACSREISSLSKRSTPSPPSFAGSVAIAPPVARSLAAGTVPETSVVCCCSSMTRPACMYRTAAG